MHFYTITKNQFMKKIIFYSDSTVMGGHELMAIKIWMAIKNEYSITFLISEKNHKLYRVLCSKDADVITLPINYNKWAIIKNYLPLRSMSIIKNEYSKLHPDLVIAIQGNINISNSGVRVATKMGIPVWSYIPLCQSLKNVSHGRYGFIKEFLRKSSYFAPDGYITISLAQKKLLCERNIDKPIFVLPNYIETSSLNIGNKVEAKSRNNLSKDKFILGYIGRFELWHKGLDRYLDFIDLYANLYEHVVFLFVGSGPAYDCILKVSERHTNVEIRSWQDDLSSIYSALDGLIMPSRFEGVSLTMLEAFYFKIPVLGNNIPELEEFLPKENLFDINSMKSFNDAIKHLIQGKIKTVELACNFKSIDIFNKNVIEIFRQIGNIYSSKIFYR